MFYTNKCARDQRSYNTKVKYCGEMGLKKFFIKTKCLKFQWSFGIVW